MVHNMIGFSCDSCGNEAYDPAYCEQSHVFGGSCDWIREEYPVCSDCVVSVDCKRCRETG